MTANHFFSTAAGAALSIALDERAMTLMGELDLASCVELRAAFARCSGHDDLQVDVAQLSFIDAAGIGCLVDEGNRRRDRAQSMTVREPTARVARVLALVDLDGLAVRPVPYRTPSAAVPVPRTGRSLWQVVNHPVAVLHGALDSLRARLESVSPALADASVALFRNGAESGPASGDDRASGAGLSR